MFACKNLSINYIVGSLFPRKQDGISPNIQISSNLEEIETNDGTIIRSKAQNETNKDSLLKSKIKITSNPVEIPGSDKFLENYYIPEITAKTYADGTPNKSSIFGIIQQKVVGGWTGKPKNQSMKSLLMLGYTGLGSEHSATDDATWSKSGSTDDQWYPEIQKLENYHPEKMWGNYKSDPELATTLFSDYDIENLKQNLPEGKQQLPEGAKPNLWYPSILYTYGIKGEGTSYAGPVLFASPGVNIELKFKNKIKLGNLNKKKTQQATLVKNSTYGNAASDGLGGTTSTNYHLHGSHTNPGGFGDNVVSRYTTGQNWTTKIDLPNDHGQGSYWYHPHYHPSVNQQVYGGMSGFMQVGDPLSKVPGFEDVPRNLAVIKMVYVGVEKESGKIQLDGIDAFGGDVTNALPMVTVNGEFQPTGKVSKSGWQALTLSNQSNQAFYNISLKNDKTEKILPLFIYGEDGHQYPKIKLAKGTLTTRNDSLGLPNKYKQQSNVISLAPGKRVDVLVYLPEGKTEIMSSYSFGKNEQTFETANLGGYPDLSTQAQSLDNISDGKSAGPLAYFVVKDQTPTPSDSSLKKQIKEANRAIEKQFVEPSTEAQDYDDNAIPEINLFQTNQDDEEVWSPLRSREFNWAKGTLVGEPSEWDLPTQKRISEYNASVEASKKFNRYQKLSTITKNSDNWFGYNNPFLINDHVFPNGSITIAQLGTLEEWKLRNWSVNKPTKYIGHPFHIHINDYQTLNSDTELNKKRSLEDVTMLNSSGYLYVDTSPGVAKKDKYKSQEPFRGNFHSIGGPNGPDYNALDKTSKTATWGANDQTVRMLFQDYIGTYVFHCHILPHEDAGMMQVITVVENTDSSWAVPAESDNYENKNGEIELYQAQAFTKRIIKPEPSFGTIKRMQAGDLTQDFTQDLVVSRDGGPDRQGIVQIYDGAAAMENNTKLLSQVIPYQSSLAPWSFAEDFTGNGHRDLVTVGYEMETTRDDDVELNTLSIKGWTLSRNGKQWSEEYEFNPFEHISIGTHIGHSHSDEMISLSPVKNLTHNQVSVAMADMNLDNFQDIAMAYAIDDGIRVVVLDGAALSLNHQTGTMEGGYFPDENVLADALITDDSLTDLSSIVLTAGFSSYAQSALEDLIITTQSEATNQNQILTTQLQAGHFIATSEKSSDGSHHGHGAAMIEDDRVNNLRDNSMPLNIVETQHMNRNISVTPVISGVFGTTGLLVDDNIVIAQGVSDGDYSNGNSSSSRNLFNTSQELVLNVADLNEVNHKDLKGVLGTDPSTTYKKCQTLMRINMSNLTYQAYAGTGLHPSNLAEMSGAILGQGAQAKELVNTLLDNAQSAKAITKSYGGGLESLSTKDIVTGATNNLYGRDPIKGEIKQWRRAVAEGLDKTLVPLSILQSTSGDDIYRTGLMSSSAKWNQAQWSTNANLQGSFGQGLQNDEHRYKTITKPLSKLGVLTSWTDANNMMEDYSAASLEHLIGSEISKSGFF